MTTQRDRIRVRIEDEEIDYCGVCGYRRAAPSGVVVAMIVAALSTAIVVGGLAALAYAVVR